MSGDPNGRFKNMQIDVFGGGKSSSNSVSQFSGATKMGWQIGTGAGKYIGAWFLKRRLEKEGYDPITIDAAVEAAKTDRDIEGILSAARQSYRAKKKQQEILENPPPIHGAASWSDVDEVVNADLTLGQGHGDGINLGKLSDGKDIYWRGESHLMTVAPTRTGKGTTQIVPNLLQYKGSAVVLDPKGELALATAKWRARHVGPVFVLNPFKLPGIGNSTNAFNPLDYIENEQDATKLAEMIYPRTGDDRQQFFDNEAIGFLAGVILFVAKFAPDEDRNLGTIRDTVSARNRDFYGLLDAMADPVMPSAIRNAALNVKSKTSDTGQPRLIDSLSQHLRIWDTLGLREATSRSDFDFRQLKDEAITVYLVLPFDELTTYSTFVQMIFAAALDSMLTNANKPDIPVLFVLDEFLALKPDERFVSALRTHASAGVRMWFFLQDLPTLEQKYPTTWKSFLQVEVKTFFGTDDPNTAELISNYLGETTVAYELPNGGLSVGGNSAGYSISENVQLSGRKLMTPTEVVRLLSSHRADLPRQAIHFLRGVAPTQATLTPWFLDETMQERTHGN